MVALAEAESRAHETESFQRGLQESSAVLSAAAYSALIDATRKPEEIAVVARPCHLPRAAVGEASSRRVIPAGYSSGTIHGLVASAHVFHTAVLGRRLAPLQGRHTMEDTS